ncbi:MAG: acetate--CoA ligase family protein [Thermoguttaceae bacterium]|nr:acetate--CoA ligase family protein [Thermoguttaceae bacterium]
MADVSKLDALFYPKSVAVIGASTKPNTCGNDILKNLLDTFKGGPVYPINPKAPEILGVKAYQSVKDVPGDVDLAVIVVPSKFVLQTTQECADKGVKALVCISAGFKEVDAAGAELEKAFAEKVRENGMILVGPNCLGILNAEDDARMNATFAAKTPKAGTLAFISQSGALCTSVLDFAEERDMGFSKFVSFGNKADVNEIDLLNYLADDPNTKVIAMYLESITNGAEFQAIASKIFYEKKKPILVLKSGRSAAGAKAVSSHTGSLAGNDAVYQALLSQSGIQRVDTIAELFDYAALYCNQPLPRGNRLAIITNAGGPGIMATDAAERFGLTLATISDETKAVLREQLPAAASLRNPVDVIGDAKHDRYEVACKEVFKDAGVDMGLVILTPQSMTDIDEIGEIIPQVAKDLDIPVVASFMGAEMVTKGVQSLRDGGVPNYSFPEDAVRALGAAYKLSEQAKLTDREPVAVAGTDKAKCAKIIAEKLGDADSKYLAQAECREIFACYGLPLLKSAVVTSAEEAGKTVGEWNTTVVMKVMSADVKHKFDAGGVLLNIKGAEAAAAGFDQIYANIAKNVPGAKIDSILIEEMAPKGTEVILGCNRDPKFGPLVMFGMGGTTAELMKDVQFRLAPTSKYFLHSMLENTKVYKLMNNYRGLGQHDLAALEDALIRLSVLVSENPEIAELDINPLIVHAEGLGCSVADSRIVLKKVK